jgi:hypothetical protein
MRRVPDAGLVVEDVVLQPAARGGSPAVDQVLHPTALERGVGRNARVVRIVAGHELAVGSDTVARVGKPLPVVAGLRPVLRDRKACELAPARAQSGDPADRGNGQHRFGIGRARSGEERIPPLAGSGAAVADALKVPVVAAVVGVRLPVVPSRVVAAVPVERAVQVVQLGRRRVRNAVDVGIDRAAVRVDVDVDRDSRVLRVRGRRPSGV